MHLAPLTGGIQAELPFVAASGHYNKALKNLEFPPNAMIDVKVALTSALEETAKAVELLAPVTDHSDMFVSRNATASVESAKIGVTALKNALATLEIGPASGLIPMDTFIKAAQSTITQAESALWWE